MTETPSSPDGDAAPPLWRRAAPYAIVATIGLLAAIAATVTAERDPGVFAVPILAATVMSLVVLRFVDRRADVRTMERLGRDTGLRYAGQQTLPPVTPVLVGARPPRVAHVLAGELDPGGPPVRVARVAQRTGPPLLVCLTDAHDAGTRFADPHRILALTDAQHDDEPLAPDLLDWLGEHPLRLALATGEGALVVAAPAGGDADPPYRVLLEAAREAHARLTRDTPLWGAQAPGA